MTTRAPAVLKMKGRESDSSLSTTQALMLLTILSENGLDLSWEAEALSKTEGRREIKGG